MHHFVLEDIFKGIRSTGEGAGAPFFQGKKGQAKGQFGGQFAGSTGKEWGPRGGHIKEISASTGKPIYYKQWEGGAHKPVVAQPHEGGASEGYSVYSPSSEHVIGRTSSGKPIHAMSGTNNTRKYQWDDHRDASHAHFTLMHYLMNLVNERRKHGHSIKGLFNLIDAHSKFARHHKEQALKDLLHGKQKGLSEEDLSARKKESGLFGHGTKKKRSKGKSNE